MKFKYFDPDDDFEDGPRYVGTSLSLYSLLYEPSTNIFQYNNVKSLYVLGQCKGLLCLTLHGDIYFTNPTTRKNRKLPKLKGMGNYGFCYDESNGDFKLVTTIFARKSRPSKFRVSIYSSKTSRWRRIPDIGVKGRITGNGVFLNGGLYWSVGPYESINPRSVDILCLDIKTETFRTVLPPKYGVYKWTLSTFGTSLSVCEFDHNHVNLWVMRDFGGELWEKLYTIPYVERPTTNLDGPTKLSSLKPINLAVNGDIILELNSHIKLYDPEENTYEVMFDYGKGYVCDTQDTYVESLFSPYFKSMS